MKSGFLRRLSAAALLSTVLLAGCEPASSKMAVGRVDTAVILQDDPDYQSMSLEYRRQQIDIKQDFVRRLQAAENDEVKVKDLQEKFMKAQEGFNKEWEVKTGEFLKTRHSAIQTTAADIAKRKNIDLVVIDSEQYPTVEWGGVDMTKDLALAMSSGTDSSTPSPKASASPSASPKGGN